MAFLRLAFEDVLLEGGFQKEILKNQWFILVLSHPLLEKRKAASDPETCKENVQSQNGPQPGSH